MENLVSRVKSDTLWMNVDTRNKYRFIRKKYQQYLNQEYAEARMWQEPIEKDITKLYDKYLIYLYYIVYYKLFQFF